MDFEPPTSDEPEYSEGLFSAFDDVADPGLSAQPGMEIGHYRLIKLLGVGGMGQVWMAEQEQPVHRAVALKLIREGSDTKRIVARFEAERQALAIMNHDNIAKVYDAGTTDAGMPYFVMELVQGDEGNGISLTKFCDKNQLGIRERLRLFSLTCRAVQHAHLRGIVHRDLKPTNILVAATADGPVPKIIDFGLAKALGTTAKLSNLTVDSEAGKPMGTFHYMSPEQAAGQEDVDTRTDIYSLGVVLYELLAGSKPIESTNPMVVWKSILDETPKPPSDRFNETWEFSDSVALNRQIAPARLKQILRGELDWVVMKALEKDRHRRYQSANEFADDVQRFLRNEAVAARPPSHLYRARKFVSNNRLMVVSAVLIASAFLGAIYGMIWGVTAEATKRQVAATVSWYHSAALWQDGKTEESIRILKSIPEEYRTPSWHNRRLQYEGDDQVIYRLENPIKIRGLVGDAERGTLAWCTRKSIQVFDIGASKVTQELSTDAIQNITCLAMSGDGATIAAGFADNTVTIWTLGEASPETTRREFIAFRKSEFRPLPADEDTNPAPPKPVDGIRSLEINRDGSRIVTGGADGFVRLLDGMTGEQIACVAHAKAAKSQLSSGVPKGEAGVNDVAFSASAELYSAASDGRFAVWRIEEVDDPDAGGEASEACRLSLVSSTHFPERMPVGKEERILPGGRRLVLSPNGMEVAALQLSGDEKSISFEDVSNFDLSDRHGFSLRTDVQIWDFRFSPDASRVAAIVRNAVEVWDIRSRSMLFQLQGHFGRVTGAVFTASGSQLVTSGQDGTVRIWDVTSGNQIPRLRGHQRSVMGAAVSPNNDIVSVGDGGSVRLWDLETGSNRLLREVNLSTPANAVAFSSDGKLAYSRGSTVVVQPWPGSDVPFAAPFDAAVATSSDALVLDHGTEVNAIAFDRQGAILATVGSEDSGQQDASKRESELRLWDTKSGQLLATYSHGNEKVRCVAISDRGLVATGTQGGMNKIRIFDPSREKTGPIRELEGHVAAVYSVAFQPGGDILVAGSKSDVVLLWNLKTWQMVGEVRAYSDAYSLAFTPDGKRFAVGLGKGNIKLFKLRENEPPYEESELTGHAGLKRQIRSLQFSHDGSLLVSASSDRTLRLWDFRHEGAPSFSQIPQPAAKGFRHVVAQRAS